MPAASVPEHLCPAITTRHHGFDHVFAARRKRRARRRAVGSAGKGACRRRPAIRQARRSSAERILREGPAGALADRDYSHTALDPEKARDIINQYRQDKGLKPLKLNAELTEAAKAHSRDLAKWDRISHYGSDGSNPWDRVKRTGFKARLAAENVGTGQIDFKEVMRGWKESPGHNKNLLLGDAHAHGHRAGAGSATEFKSFWTLVIGYADVSRDGSGAISPAFTLEEVAPDRDLDVERSAHHHIVQSAPPVISATDVAVAAPIRP